VQVLLEFPCELFSAVLAGRWAAGATPFGPWMRGYWLRLLTAAAATTLVRDACGTRLRGNGT
jgi:MFS transporter, PAT family, solute carrier family 33 (acetyl-CoA transportor), member 1